MMIFVLQAGGSPLIYASHGGHLDVVKALIEAGANVNQTTEVGTSFSRLVYIQIHVHYVIVMSWYEWFCLASVLVPFAGCNACN